MLNEVKHLACERFTGRPRACPGQGCDRHSVADSDCLATAHAPSRSMGILPMSITGVWGPQTQNDAFWGPLMGGTPMLRKPQRAAPVFQPHPGAIHGGCSCRANSFVALRMTESMYGATFYMHGLPRDSVAQGTADPPHNGLWVGGRRLDGFVEGMVSWGRCKALDAGDGHDQGRGYPDAADHSEDGRGNNTDEYQGFHHPCSSGRTPSRCPRR
jgi:hypothetical protein